MPTQVGSGLFWTIRETAAAWAEEVKRPVSITTVKKKFYENRIPGATKVDLGGRGLILIPAGTPMPPAAEWGSLTVAQRAAWNRGRDRRLRKAVPKKTRGRA